MHEKKKSGPWAILHPFLIENFSTERVSDNVLSDSHYDFHHEFLASALEGKMTSSVGGKFGLKVRKRNLKWRRKILLK